MSEIAARIKKNRFSIVGTLTESDLNKSFSIYKNENKYILSVNEVIEDVGENENIYIDKNGVLHVNELIEV